MIDTAFLKSKLFRWIVIALGELILILAIFQLGLFVGFHKANFAFRWADSYHRNFGGPRGGFFNDNDGRDFVGGHGTTGLIIKIENGNIIIKGKSEAEKIITINKDTAITAGRTAVTASELKVDDRVVVIGSPQTDGTISAKLIRVFQSAQTTSTTTR